MMHVSDSGRKAQLVFSGEEVKLSARRNTKP